MAAAECPSPETEQWISGRPYAQGDIVFHDGHWFQSRERQAGHEPGSGFSWKVVAAPDCSPAPAPQASSEATPATPAANTASEPEEDLKKLAESRCPDINEFSFGQSYSPGALVKHQGEVYQAMRPTTGTMPGVGMPPQWERHSTCVERQSD
ncbi:hypothetical protein [Allohahella marinimesophila]|uniref:hypothetical protein n=1 Tax=Allohahella marinimesophila TaxID=1054972 RepID=UPI0031D17963